jgi:hypothetical protein
MQRGPGAQNGVKLDRLCLGPGICIWYRHGRPSSCFWVLGFRVP